jgi:3-oxoacyl-(acyl-carrier-protein) synthase
MPFDHARPHEPHATIVRYEEAELLAAQRYTVIVYAASSGDSFKFTSPSWFDRGNPKPVEQVLDRYGEAGMDDEFVFIWMHQ